MQTHAQPQSVCVSGGWSSSTSPSSSILGMDVESWQKTFVLAAPEVNRRPFGGVCFIKTSLWLHTAGAVISPLGLPPLKGNRTSPHASPARFCPKTSCAAANTPNPLFGRKPHGQTPPVPPWCCKASSDHLRNALLHPQACVSEDNGCQLSFQSWVQTCLGMRNARAGTMPVLQLSQRSTGGTGRSEMAV